MTDKKAKMLFVLEGNTDIRFISGLCDYFDVSLMGPATYLNDSGGLKDRMKDLGLNVPVIELSGGRLVYQFKSFIELLKIAKNYDFLFSQENLRGTFSAGLASSVTGVPLYSHSGMPPRQYFRCRYKRGQISWPNYFLGDSLIRFFLWANSWLCDFWFALGPYLYEVFSEYKREIGYAHYYGIDTHLYHPVSLDVKRKMREELGISQDKNLIFFSSRVSHEKDPDTVLHVVASLYKEHNLILMNLSGGHEKMRELAIELGLEGHEEWLVTRPAAHPMKELPRYYQVSDLVIQSSLEEGLGLSPLEAMACEIPVIATDVGGMKSHLHPYCEMVAVSDIEAMKGAIIKVLQDNQNKDHQSQKLLKARQYIEQSWSREHAFNSLSKAIYTLLSGKDLESVS